MKDKVKIYIFSDEAGSWHDPQDVYVRSWVAVSDRKYLTLVNKVDEISSMLGANELKWKSFAGSNFFDRFNDLDFRIFITASSPKDIGWDSKYLIMRDFSKGMAAFNFGKLDEDLKTYINDRVLRDIKNALFLRYYERQHMENAKRGIESVIRPTNFDLIYRVDPPQHPLAAWEHTLRSMLLSGELEFPRSERTQGIQFADVIAGCFRSLLIKDSRYNQACLFFNNIKGKFIRGTKSMPNPNLIFYPEINNELIKNCQEIWTL